MRQGGRGWTGRGGREGRDGKEETRPVREGREGREDVLFSFKFLSVDNNEVGLAARRLLRGYQACDGELMRGNTTNSPGWEQSIAAEVVENTNHSTHQ